MGNATNLGEPINSEANEWSPFVDKVGRIYFDSNREGSIGDYSIWVAEHAQGTPEVFDVIASGASEREITMNDKFSFSPLTSGKVALVGTIYGFLFSKMLLLVKKVSQPVLLL